MTNKLIRKHITVDVLKLIERYSTQDGVQLDRARNSLLEMQDKPQVNIDPILMIVIAHFFENTDDKDIELLPNQEQKDAARQLKRIAPLLTRDKMRPKIASVYNEKQEGHTTNLTAEVGVEVNLEGDSEEMARLRANPEFARALQIIETAKAEGRPLTQDQLNEIINILGRGIEMTPAMWKHSLDTMVKDKKIAKVDEEELMRKLHGMKVVNLQQLDDKLGRVVMAHTDAKNEGKIYLTGGSVPAKKDKTQTVIEDMNKNLLKQGDVRKQPKPPKPEDFDRQQSIKRKQSKGYRPTAGLASEMNQEKIIKHFKAQLEAQQKAKKPDSSSKGQTKK